MPVCQIAPENEVTLKNLLIAYESESNAYIMYTAYAERADADGLPGAASLFRATARTEQIHASNNAHLIRKLGGEPEAQIQQVEVKTTLENLTTALVNEVYEIDSMYPRFLAENRSTNNSAAQTLTWALETKRTNAHLLSEEIEQMGAVGTDSLASTPVDFFVRPVCGYVSKTPEPERCWNCNHLCSTFETIR
ncbi:MAG: rubrerythrin family protein [Terracidiphilus sp.]|jgi:rubrerythrin